MFDYIQSQYGSAVSDYIIKAGTGHYGSDGQPTTTDGWPTTGGGTVGGKGVDTSNFSEDMISDGTPGWEATHSVAGANGDYIGDGGDDLFTLGEDAQNADISGGGGVNWIDATQADLVGNDWTIVIGETEIDPNQSGSFEGDDMSGKIVDANDNVIATFDNIDKIEW
jgi:hypothetical protein